MNDPILQQRLELFSPKYQSFVQGDLPELAAQTYGDEFNLSEKERVVVANGIRLYLLCFFNKNELAVFLSDHTSLTNDVTPTIVANILKPLDPKLLEMIEDAYKQFSANQEKVNSANNTRVANTPIPQAPTQPTPSTVPPQPTPKPTPIPAPASATPTPPTQAQPTPTPTPKPQTAPPTPATAPNQAPTIPAVRTMQQDSQRVQEQVHTSSQSDLLARRQAPAPQSGATEAPKPRWPSERTD